MFHPGTQSLLVLTGSLDALSTRMGYAIGWFQKEQRSIGLPGLNHSSQAESKAINLLDRSAFTGKLHSSCRRNAVVIVASAALGFFENGIHAPRKILREECRR
jgi:hypothetical protein